MAYRSESLPQPATGVCAKPSKKMASAAINGSATMSAVTMGKATMVRRAPRKPSLAWQGVQAVTLIGSYLFYYFMDVFVQIGRLLSAHVVLV